MIAWLSANFVNIILILAVALLVFLCVRSMVRDKKAGKGCSGCCASCGGACAGCAGCCHAAAAQERR